MRDKSLPLTNKVDLPHLYKICEGIECRRCAGIGFDPDGKYPCLLCNGTKKEFGEFSKSFHRVVCSTHTDKDLIPVAQYSLTGETGVAYLSVGTHYFNIYACPICLIPCKSDS